MKLLLLFKLGFCNSCVKYEVIAVDQTLVSLTAV
jgi:hypothetical protein